MQRLVSSCRQAAGCRPSGSQCACTCGACMAPAKLTLVTALPWCVERCLITGPWWMIWEACSTLNRPLRCTSICTWTP